MDMGRVMRVRGIGQIITNIYSLIGRQKEKEHSIFIWACKDFAKVPCDTGISEENVDHLITSCKCLLMNLKEDT